MRFIALPNALLLLLASIACNDSGASRVPGAEVTDSAGIPIVTSAVTDAEYARFADAPALSIGELEGPEALLFSRIEMVARDGEGNVIVADGASDEIRVFDSRGSHLRTLGGRGEGPGEFGALRGVWPAEDGGIVAYDLRRTRISRFDAMGGLVETAALVRSDVSGFVTPVGLADPGSLLVEFQSLPPGLTEEPARGSVFLVRYGFDGLPIDTVAHLQGQTTTAVTRTLGQSVMVEMVPVPFAPSPAAVASPGRIAITLGEAYEVRFLDPAGALGHIARLNESPSPRTGEDLAAYARGTTRADLDQAALQDLVESFEGLPLPPALPAYVELVSADTGEMWARRYSLPGAAMARWDVFAADGHYLGHVDVPSRFAVEEVSRGQVLIVARDDLDIERVQAWDLILH